MICAGMDGIGQKIINDPKNDKLTKLKFNKSLTISTISNSP